MTNNDILRRLRFALDLPDQKAVALFSMDPATATTLSAAQYQSRLCKETEDGFHSCSDAELRAFLDGLIVSKRGLREHGTAPAAVEPGARLSKNDILKKLRIAMGYREQEMLEVLKLGGVELSKSELGALFRGPQHKHFRTAGDQVVRAFLRGLTSRLRGEPEAP